MSRIMDIIDRQGLPRPQTDADWAKYTAEKQIRRAQNVINAVEVLQANGIEFTRDKHNGKVQFIITHENCGIVYYPEEGRWYTVDKEHFGVRNLVKYLLGSVK